jgi:hypothetical protein
MTAKTRRALHMTRTDRMVTAYAQPASGPGWSNRPLYVIVEDRDGKMRSECLQPGEFSRDLELLYGIASVVHGELLKMLESA